MPYKPKHLRKGDTVGICSPSSGLWERSELWRGIETIESWGLKVKVSPNAYKNNYYLAGADEERAADLNAMFRDESVDAIICTQGGYGAGRILPLLDYDMIQKNPKIFLGYSDITALHLAFAKMCDLVTFHGPTASGFYPPYLTPYRLKYLEKALFSPDPIGLIEPFDDTDYIVKMVPGVVEAPIVCGNLTLICASLGTPYEIDTRGKIFVIEDLDTEPWIFDHMLTHLLNAGKFRDCAGIVVGRCLNCDPRKHEPGFQSSWSLEDLLFDRLAPLDLPLIYGLPIGHTEHMAVIPENIGARLDGGAGTLEITEAATR